MQKQIRLSICAVWSLTSSKIYQHRGTIVVIQGCHSSSAPKFLTFPDISLTFYRPFHWSKNFYLHFNEVAIPPAICQYSLFTRLLTWAFSVFWVFFFLIWQLKPHNHKIKKGFSTLEKAQITRLPGWYKVNMYNCTSINLTLPDE